MGEQEIIYHTTDEKLLETSIGNLVLKMDGKLYTPPSQLGLLSGIYRNHLLESKRIEEKILTVEDLKQAEIIYACNTVRGLYELSLKEN